MKSERFVWWFSVFVGVIFLMVLAAAQSNPTSVANQPNVNQPSLSASAASGVPQDLPFGHGRTQGAKTAARSSKSQASGLNLAPPVAYDLGGVGANAVAVADLNGDGKLDIVVADWPYCVQTCPNGSVSVLLGNGDGTFQTAATYLSGALGAGSVAIGDVNGDGIPDLVVANWWEENSGSYYSVVGVLLGNGDGTFQPAVTYLPGPIGDDSVALADVNGDGKLDIVVANFYGESGTIASVEVMLGNGDGTFQPAIAYSVGFYAAESLAVADVNGDGKLDIVVGSYCGDANCDVGGVSVLLGNGDGTFQAPITYSSGAPAAKSVVVADLNGDGKPDIAVTDACPVGLYSVCNGSSLVSVLLGNGDGTFQPAVTYNSGGYYYLSYLSAYAGANALAIADMNGDGNRDLVVANICQNSSTCSTGGVVSVLLGNGDGTFQAPVTYISDGFYADSLTVADVNGDGTPDIVAINQSNYLSLYPYQTTTDSTVAVMLGVPPGTKTSTTSIASNANPWTYGQTPVTLTATVTPPSGGTATGKVTFYDGSTSLGSASLSNDVASLSGIIPPLGWHMFTARYSGDNNVPPSNSTPLDQAAIEAPTTTALASSANPSYPGQTVTYTATVTGQYGGQVTGSVAFWEDKHELTYVTVTNGQATYSVTYTKPAGHNIWAGYSGDINNLASNSPVLLQRVRALPALTTTTLTTSGSPSYVNQPVTFTATVTSTYDKPIPDGETVTFYDGATQIGTGLTASGVATFTTSTLTAKTHKIKAAYPGDQIFKASYAIIQQVVILYPSTTTLTSSPNPSQSGQAVTLTATVTSGAPGEPTGKVTFMNGTTQLGTAKLIAGTATLVTTKLPVGTLTLTANYGGDAQSAKSSGTTTQVVNP